MRFFNPRTVRVLSVCVGVMAACLQSAWATTYYVRTSGSDSNAGTSVSKPFKTIAKAVSLAAAGDTVYIAPGTYKEAVATVRAGTSTNSILFIADKTGAVFGVRAGKVTIQKAGATGVTIQHDYIEFRGFRVFKNSVGVLVQNCKGIRLYDLDIPSNTTDGVQINNAIVTIDACKSRSNKDNGVEVQAGATVQINDGYFYSNTTCGVSMTASGATLRMDRAQVYSNKSHGVQVNNSPATLVNCLIYKNTGSGVSVGAPLGSGAATGVTAWHCTIARNKTDAFTQASGTCTLKNSILAYSTSVGLRRTGGAMTNQYNLYYSNTGGNYSGQAAGTGEAVGDPKFSGTSSYTILAASAAINVGANSSGVTATDIIGASRPQGGGWDAGCYEGIASPIFTDVSAAVGFNLTNCTSENDGDGMAWVDIDADGDLDCIVTGTTAYLMANNGAGASFSATSLGALRGQVALLDADNDGDPDVFTVCATDANTERLYTNSGGSLTSAGNCGLGSGTTNDGVVAADVDADGYCDLVEFSGNGNRTGINQKSSTPAFTESAPAGLNGGGSAGNGDFVSSADVNEDGYLDFFYHYSGGQLFLSNGLGAYANASAAAGISVTTGTSSKIGSAWADYDNDGDIDLFVSKYASGNPGFLWENDGTGVFDDVTADASLDDASGQRGVAWGDYDNDGILDLLVATRSGGCQLYQGLGDGAFIPDDRGGVVTGDCADVAFVDYNNDGQLDIAVTRVSGTMVLLKNTLNVANYLKVRIVGAGKGGTNSLGIGTRVELYDSGGTYLGRRDIGTARGFGGTEPFWAQFGGVNPASTYTVKVYFKSGVQTVSVVPNAVSTTIGARTISKMVTITEPSVLPDLIITRWREVSPEE